MLFVHINNMISWSCDVHVGWCDKFLLLFSYNCLLLSSMPKKSWTSEEQKTWLFSKLADFRQAQDAKTTPNFFIELYQNFHEEWPLSPPDADELSNADGNEEKAKTVKQKASEQVSFFPSTDIFCCMIYPC